MDGHRFDEMARTLASGASRRRVLKGLAGGALAFTGLRPGPTEARKCRQSGKNCRSHADCCSEFCDTTTYECAPAPPATGFCQPQITGCPCFIASTGAICTSPDCAGFGACLVTTCRCF